MMVSSKHLSEVIASARLVMLYHRQNIIDIQKFLESENAHEGLLEARELLKSPSHFANLVAHQQKQVKLPAKST